MFRIALGYVLYYAEAMQTISMRLPDDLLDELDRESKARHISKTELIRTSLEQTLRARPSGMGSCYDLAIDLAGSVKGLPRDIATNPKHMKGFGE